MESLRISVVVPIYNVEKYLDRCIESVVNQTYKNLEIILVDDGSPDNCPQMCDDWAKRDNRIKVVHKQNQGLGMARNTGIEVAEGEYLFFVDSDDYIDCNMFSEIVNEIVKYGKADLIGYGFRDVYQNGSFIKELKPNAPKHIYKGREVQEEFLPEIVGANPYTGVKLGVVMSASAFAFKVSALRQCDFKFVSEKDIISEDVYSLLMLMVNIHSVIVMDKVFYNYWHNSGTLSTTYKKDRFEKILDFYIKSKKLCEEKKYNDDVKMRITAPFLTFVLSCLKMEMGVMSERGFLKTYGRIKEILNNNVFNLALKSYPSYQYSKPRKLTQFFMKKKCVLPVMFLIKCRELKG